MRAEPTPPTPTPVSGFRQITETLAGALEKLAQKQAVVESCQAALTKANDEYATAKTLAEEARHKLDTQLAEILPVVNRRP